MENPKHYFNQTVITAFLVVGCIAISAISFNFAGKLQLKVGADGIQLQINGKSE